MVILWYEYALLGVLFATILGLSGYLACKFSRVRVQKWIGGAIGNFMTNLSKQAAEEEGGSSPGSSALNLGGFKIDMKTIAQLAELAKQFGLFKGGGSSGGGGW